MLESRPRQVTDRTYAPNSCGRALMERHDFVSQGRAKCRGYRARCGRLELRKRGLLEMQPVVGSRPYPAVGLSIPSSCAASTECFLVGNGV